MGEIRGRPILFQDVDKSTKLNYASSRHIPLIFSYSMSM